MRRVPDSRYISARELIRLLEASEHPLAMQATPLLDATSVELLPVSPGGLDLHTYEVRLARFQDGEGPEILGLEAFVEVLRTPVADPETLSFRTHDYVYVVLLASGQVVAVTGVATRM